MDQKKGMHINQIYREFSRQQFNKYRYKYPKMKESDITKKVLAEWEQMDDKKRRELEDYYRTKGMLPQNVGQSPTRKDVKVEKPIKGGNRAVSAKKEAAVKDVSNKATKGESQVPKSDRDDSSSDAFLKKPEVGSESGRASSEKSSQIRGRKQRTKEIRSHNKEYISFYKFYYERLTKEHPKWTPTNKTKIIKLLWRKRTAQRKKDQMRLRGKKGISLRKIKKVVHYKAFSFFMKTRLQNHPFDDQKQVKKDSLMIFKRLPRAGKRYWNRRAKQFNNEHPDPQTESKKTQMPANIVIPSFMNKVMTV